MGILSSIEKDLIDDWVSVELETKGKLYAYSQSGLSIIQRRGCAIT